MIKPALPKIVLITGLMVLLTVCAGSLILPWADAKGIKTSYKRYSIFKYKNEEVLCEPYIVKKNDWLYKIFRKKGEISEKDFPHFLSIFKEINPQISNIDAIATGNSILIPLKKVKKKDYDLSTPGNVDVPVVEFSSLPSDKDIEPFVKKHIVKRGDTISKLVDKDFLQKGGALSKEGLKAFQLANPNIKNINIVYEGMDIYLPDPAIKSQPWFQSFLSGKPAPRKEPVKEKTVPVVIPSPVDEHKLLQLKKYSSLIGGTLLSQGQMYFPGQGGSSQVLDLSSTPIIEKDDGSKILIISGENKNDLLLDQVQAYWKNLKIQVINDAIADVKNKSKNRPIKKNSKTADHRKRIEALLSQTEYDYIPDAKVPFTMNNVNLEASFGRVIRKEKTDLLINFGNVYGNALDVLKKREFEIVSINSKMTLTQLANKLFSSLGYSTWENPSFYTGNRVEDILGLYAVKESQKIFIPEKPLTLTAIDYLKKENIRLYHTTMPNNISQ